MSQLLRFKDKQKFLLYDVETESLSLKRSRPWQCAFTLYEGRKVLHEDDLYPYWEDLNVGYQAKMITGFSDYDYQSKCIDRKDALEKFLEYFLDPDTLLVGHNILGFDVYQLMVWAEGCGVNLKWEDFIPRCVDTLALARGIALGEKPQRDEDGYCLGWQYKMLSVRDRKIKASLGALAKKYEVEHGEDQMHNALNDIHFNAEIFFKQIYEIEI